MLSLGSFRAGRPDAFIHLTVPEPARFVQRNLSGGRLHGHLRLVNKYPDSKVERLQHRPKGCLFDESCGAEEFRVGLVGAHLCAACEGQLSEMMIADEALEAINQLLGYVRAATIRRVRVPATSILVGHGRADDWKGLNRFLEDELRCNVVEFNSEPTAGLYTGQRILDMLERSNFAFLVMTADDEQ